MVGSLLQKHIVITEEWASSGAHLAAALCIPSRGVVVEWLSWALASRAEAGWAGGISSSRRHGARLGPASAQGGEYGLTPHQESDVQRLCLRLANNPLK